MIENDRADALGALYAADATDTETVDVTGISPRAAGLARGTMEHRSDIDAAISDVSTSWRVERMAAVDRSILRLAAFELMYTDLSTAIVIDEAINLAKEYSTVDSSKFINGILDPVARNAREPADPVS